MARVTLTPTVYTPDHHGGHNGLSHRGSGPCKRATRLVSMRTSRMRLLCQKIDRVAPHLPAGHAGRLEEALRPVLEVMEQAVVTIEKWDRMRGYTRRGCDSAELRSIEDGGNG